jgi:hypothetical protein
MSAALANRPLPRRIMTIRMLPFRLLKLPNS